MRNYLIIVLSIMLYMFSCSDKKKYRSGEDLAIPDSLYSFFPESKQIKGGNEFFRASNAKITSSDKIWFFSATYDFRVYRFMSPELFDSLVSKHRENSIVEFKVNEDSTYFIISEEDEMKKIYGLKNLEKIYKIYKNKYILPSFHSLMFDRYGYNYKYQTICGLPEYYKILIINSGRKFVLPKNLEYDWYILPPELKHGYTSGIAYSRQNLDIIYWVITW